MLELDFDELRQQLNESGSYIDKDTIRQLIDQAETAEEDNQTLRAAIRNNSYANADTQRRLLDAANKCAELQEKLQAAESKLKLIDGVSQDAIDGGWTAYGLSSYAKSLEKNNAELHARLNSLINPCEKTEQSNELYDDTHAKLNVEPVDTNHPSFESFIKFKADTDAYHEKIIESHNRDVQSTQSFHRFKNAMPEVNNENHKE